MKLLILSILLTACTVEVKEPEKDSGVYVEKPVEHEYNTNAPPAESNKGESGCKSVFYVNGVKHVEPCVASQPHGPIYEFKNELR